MSMSYITIILHAALWCSTFGIPIIQRIDVATPDTTVATTPPPPDNVGTTPGTTLGTTPSPPDQGTTPGNTTVATTPDNEGTTPAKTPSIVTSEATESLTPETTIHISTTDGSGTGAATTPTNAVHITTSAVELTTDERKAPTTHLAQTSDSATTTPYTLSPPTSPPTTPSIVTIPRLAISVLLPSYVPPSKWRRTIVLLKIKTGFHQYIFLRGGLDDSQLLVCKNHGCKIPIRHHLLTTGRDESAYSKWSKGDNYLDWYGSEDRQHWYKNPREGYIKPEGTPMIWTTNDRNYSENVKEDGSGYSEINTYSPDYWMMDVMMDCSATYNGWFEFKGFLRELKDGNRVLNFWEKDVNQKGCQGDYTLQPPHRSTNHFGRCGAVNVYDYDQSSCKILNMPEKLKDPGFKIG